jgi:ribonucleoside-diphosphate reductase subunit M2
MLSAQSVLSPTTETNIKALLVQDWDKEEKEQMEPEPLLIANSKRFVLFPIKYHAIWNHYKDCESTFWTAEDIEFGDDLDRNFVITTDFEELSRKSQTLVLHIAALFAMDESLVGENVIAKLSKEIQSPEARSTQSHTDVSLVSK